METLLVWLALATATAALRADVPTLPLAVNVSTAGVPAGAIAQIRITLASPHQISSCTLSLDLDPAVFDTPVEAEVFGATGDQQGTALITGTRVDLNFTSDTGGIGRIPGQPVFSDQRSGAGGRAAATNVTFPSAKPPVNNKCSDALGYQYTVTQASATFKVGGPISIDSVTPGGGLLPAGTTVKIAGRGFTPGATVQIDGVAPASVTVAGAQEVDITLAAQADLTGRRVAVSKPDGTGADFTRRCPARLAAQAVTLAYIR